MYQCSTHGWVSMYTACPQCQPHIVSTATTNTEPLPTPAQEGEAEAPQDFIDKHLLKIMDMTADAMIKTHIEKMYGGLEMASVKYFMETGVVNGSFHINLKKMMIQFAKNWHTTANKSATTL